MSFPLYDVLSKDITKNSKPLTIEEKKEVVSRIQTFDQKGYDNIYTLIKIHFMKTNNESNIFDIPYEGKKNDKLIDGRTTRDIKFDIDKFPPALGRIIYNFTKIHIDVMKKEREERLL